MSEWFHMVRQLFNGTRPTNDKIKFRILGIGVAAVHLSFTILFLSQDILPLAVYNIFVTVYYSYLSYIIGKTERYLVVFVSSYIEILFHSVMATLLLGWDMGFMVYTIALIPMCFYLTYTLPVFHKNLYAPVVLSLIIWVCYGAAWAVETSRDPYYQGIPEWVEEGLYMYNTGLAFLLMLYASFLFAVEIRYMQHSLERENRTLGEIANYDPLPHLRNRRSMVPYLEQAVRGGQTFSLIMLDIDDFKKVNDTYGHSSGDEVLISVAGTVAGEVREEDYVCRWGGEEILILLKTGRDSACEVADRICREVAARPVEANGRRIPVTVTMGVAQAHSSDTVSTVIERADQKLYYGKKHGKNQVVR